MLPDGAPNKGSKTTQL